VFSTCFYTSFLSHDFLSFCTDSLYTYSYSHLSLHTRHLFAEIAYQITQVPREFDIRFLPFYTTCVIRCTCRKRTATMSHGHLYQRQVKNAFNKKVCLCKFNEGDLVLKKVPQAQKDNRGKWAPNYEGPFIVKKAFLGGALVLASMDDEELPSPVNADIVKRYYA